MHIVLGLDVGGLEYLVLNLLRKLNKTKYNLSICSLSAKGELEINFKEIKVPIYHVEKNEGIDLSLYFRLGRLFREKKIDIIHTHNSAAWFYGAVAAKLSGVKTVIHTEHSNVLSSRKNLLLAESFLSIITNVIISDSEKVKQHLVKKQRVNEKKVVTILNGIDIDRFHTIIDIKDKKKELGVSENSLVVGNVARLEPIKDHLYLLDIFKRISRQLPEAILLIVGGGSQAKKLENKARELEIEKKVIFLGTRSDVPEIVKIFDVFVLTSKNEGLPLSLLEAMASSKAVIATNVGGNPEVVIQGVTGFLLPVDEPEQMSEIIISLLQDKKLLNQMGNAGLKRVKEIFNLEGMVQKYENIYDCLFI